MVRWTPRRLSRLPTTSHVSTRPHTTESFPLSWRFTAPLCRGLSRVPQHPASRRSLARCGSAHGASLCVVYCLSLFSQVAGTAWGLGPFRSYRTHSIPLTWRVGSYDAGDLGFAQLGPLHTPERIEAPSPRGSHAPVRWPAMTRWSCWAGRCLVPLARVSSRLRLGLMIFQLGLPRCPVGLVATGDPDLLHHRCQELSRCPAIRACPECL